VTTIIRIIHNQSDTPVTYVGVDNEEPTGWAARAFAPKKDQPVDWNVATSPHEQAILTRAGTFWVSEESDDGGLVVLFQQVGGDFELSLRLVSPGLGLPTWIDITVTATGMIRAKQAPITAAQPLAKAS
jgi:hypothetical protein